jgi:hypothetical protein
MLDKSYSIFKSKCCLHCLFCIGHRDYKNNKFHYNCLLNYEEYENSVPVSSIGICDRFSYTNYHLR